MGGMDDLAAFVVARLDEDEAMAKAATPGPWVPAGADDCWFVTSTTHGLVTTGCNETPGDGMLFIERDKRDARHVARHDPAQVLRDVAAKRAILKRWEFSRNQVAVGAVNEAAGYGASDPGWPLRENSHELDVRSIAAVYSDHSDYRQEWQPEA
jgi:hypothetical protein